MSRRSLTFRLVSWYCGLLLVLGVAFAGFCYASFDRFVEQATSSTLAARADTAWGMAGDLLADKAALAALIEQRFAPEAQNRLIRISTGGQILYQSGQPEDHEFDPDVTALPAEGFTPGLVRHGDLFVFAKSFIAPDGRTVTVESGRSADVMEGAERRLVRALIFGLPVLLIVAAAGGFMLVQRALSPVEGMIEAAEAFTFNSPRNRLPLAGTEDRIDTLGRTLNRMLERLDNSYQYASRFSADAAHELRTPLAIMRGELELLATQTLPEDMQAAVENILGETARLSQIVESLISMAQMDSVAGKRAHLAVDLLALAAETIDQMRLLAVEKNIAMEPPTGVHALAAGDRDRLKQVLVNLLDNAIKYTPPGGQISVAVAETADRSILTVSDTGVGIAVTDMPFIFDRFYRVATDRGEIGAGLGLAIVRSICAAHGGEISVESTAGAGTAFRMSLPRAKDGLATSAKRLTLVSNDNGI
jgi:signal transduction histidine kinase